MRTLTAGAEAARERSHSTPLVLLKIEFTDPTTLTLRVSDRELKGVLGFDWQPLVQSWGTLEQSLEELTTASRPSTLTVTFFNGVPVETQGGVVKDRLSDIIRTLDNTDEAYEWSSAKATLYYLVDQSLTTGDEVTLGVFYLEDPVEIDRSTVEVRMSDVSLYLKDKAKTTVITRAEFPSCDKEEINTRVPVALGSVKSAVAKWLVGGVATTLNEDLDRTETTITLTDASEFPSSGSVLVDIEIISYTGKSGNDLTGAARGASSTTATTHSTSAKVYEVRTGSNAYRAVVSEVPSGFTVSAITNVRVNDAPTRTSPTTQLAAADIALGKTVAAISFTPSNVKSFHIIPLQSGGLNGTNPSLSETLNSTGNATWTRTLIPVLGAGTNAEYKNGVVQRHVKFTFTVNSGSFAISGTCRIYRTDPATGSEVNLRTDNAGQLDQFTGTFTFDYETGNILTDETFTAFFTGDADSFNFTWTIDEYSVVASITGGAAGDSTAAHVIGEVTCDVDGVVDDGSGTISGTASLLLENPVDQCKLVLSQLYPGVTLASDFGSTWATTRARLQGVVKWAWLFTGKDDLDRFLADAGEQSRSLLYVDSGKFEMKYLDSPPASDLEIDYEREVFRDAPARLDRTPRMDVVNSYAVDSDFNYGDGVYKRSEVYEDLAQTGFTDRVRETLTLSRVQDAESARVLGVYRLGWRKRQRLVVRLETWWSAIQLQAADHFVILNHPLIARHGGDELVFRVVRLRRTLQTGRLGIVGVEARVPPEWWAWWQTQPSRVPTWKVALGL